MSFLSPKWHIAWIRKVMDDIRASYWFIPACLVFLSAAFAWLAHFAPSSVTDALPLPRALSEITVEGARSLLSAIATSVAGITGVMFSLTLVAVTHAAGQYGPRLIGNFMRDRGNQWSLGILIAVFVFALITLALTAGVGEDVARLSVVIALLLSFVAVGTMIYFVHHVPETVNVSNLTAGLGERFATMIRQEIDDYDLDGTQTDIPDRDPDHQVVHSETGYIQTLAYSQLRRIAGDCDLILRFEATPGDFVAPVRPIVSVWGTLKSENRERIIDAIAIGRQPTEAQTLTFVADQIVEMIALALSPGINDPFTAINCLNWLCAGLGQAVTYQGGLRCEETGRIHGNGLDFAELYEHTFPAALPYIIDDVMTRQRTVGLLRSLASLPGDRHRRLVLRDLRRLVAAANP